MPLLNTKEEIYMAINMLSESDYISCPKCKSMAIREDETFTLKKRQTPSGVKLHKQILSKAWLCAKCGESVTDQVKKLEII